MHRDGAKLNYFWYSIFNLNFLLLRKFIGQKHAVQRDEHYIPRFLIWKNVSIMHETLVELQIICCCIVRHGTKVNKYFCYIKIFHEAHKMCMFHKLINGFNAIVPNLGLTEVKQ